MDGHGFCALHMLPRGYHLIQISLLVNDPGDGHNELVELAGVAFISEISDREGMDSLPMVEFVIDDAGDEGPGMVLIEP